MRLPVKINKVRIIIAKLDKSFNVRDADFRETIGYKKFADPIEVYGQVNFFSKGKYQYKTLTRSPSGNIEDIAGRIVFRRTDLERQLVTIDVGDKLISVGKLGKETIVNGRIVCVNPYSFRLGVNLLISAEFVYDYDKRSSIKKI